MQCEEAGSEAIEGHKHRSDYIWRNSQPSLWEADGNPKSYSEANAVPRKILSLLK